MNEDTTQIILDLRRRVKDLEDTVAIMIPEPGGDEETYHKALDMDGYRGTLAQVLVHGQWARLEGDKVNKACLRVGESSLYCMDELTQTGPLGVSRGVNGKFLSQVDSLPAGVTVEV